MNNLIKNQILRRIFAVLIITLLFLIPVYLMYYFLSESIILDHDLFILYGNNFFAPDHGRYIATAFVNFFVEHLPVISNTHFFDLNKLFVFPVQLFILVIIFSMISYGFLLFCDKKNETDKWIWLLGYLVSFFILFNEKFSFFNFAGIFSFFEYEASLIPYIIFLASLIYFYTKKMTPNMPVFILILVASFFSGISVEVLNIPSITFLSVVMLSVTADFFQS